MPDWVARAACADLNTEAFMVTLRGLGDHLPAAVAVCHSCPVVGACLADGWEDEWSVRGGTTPRQRDKMRQAGARPAFCACGARYVPSAWSPRSCGSGCPAQPGALRPTTAAAN